MFLKVTSLLPLLLASTFAELATLNCGNKDAAACKVEFVKQLDIKIRDYFVRVTKRQVNDIVNIFEMALKELPANNKNAIILKDSIKALKEGLIKYEANTDDYAMMRNITSDLEFNMQPHFTFAPADQKSIPDLEKLLEKYNYTEKMEEFHFNETMAYFAKIWQESYASLRPKDHKAYPEYEVINNITKELTKNGPNSAEFDKVAREFTLQLRKFMKIPALEILVFENRV